MILLLFWAVLGGAILVGFGFGRTPERIGAAAIAAAALATAAVNQPDDMSARLSIAAINLGLLAALTTLAMAATRWWLLVAAGAQLAAVIVQLTLLLAAEADALTVWTLRASITTQWVCNLAVLFSLAWGALEAQRAPYARLKHQVS
ncbi:hypothetical protein IWC96_04990 [Brevundimonas sp. BAL450]|uniref:hypothetical protein n=1 Tax=Brevundimonas sp. BAL450 TaxID=1708162 RepID=UPI0018C9A9BE|nr:hypothetical protein [Brevundimonas sp. BAL450]MBG7614637.1 hypothetical protein [Brevundimonas sp. BAL450]